MTEKPIRVLMLILASDTHPIYKELRNIWKTYMKSSPQIDAWFYMNDPNQTEECCIKDEYTISVKCPNGHTKLYTKFCMALQYMRHKFGEYDYICRPNESSFFVFSRYLNFLKDKPRSNVGIGTVVYYGSVPFLSGCGFTISCDVAERMLDLHEPDGFVDDVTIGIVLKKLNTEIVKYEYTFYLLNNKHSFIDNDKIFHFRCKHHPTREQDVIVQKELLARYYTAKSKI